MVAVKEDLNHEERKLVLLFALGALEALPQNLQMFADIRKDKEFTMIREQLTPDKLREFVEHIRNQ